MEGSNDAEHGRIGAKMDVELHDETLRSQMTNRHLTELTL
jgi:hypothetical protein